MGTSVLSACTGEVQVKTADAANWVGGVVGAVLKDDDAVKTGAEGEASITFFDGSVIELRANTQIEISELKQGKTKSIKLKQEIGETWSKVEKLTDMALRYEIETPVAVAAVRGSEMIVTVATDGTTTVQNLEGQISVTAQGVEVEIPVGQTSTVEPGQPPSSFPPDVHINTDGANDLFDLSGNPVSDYQYLDITNEWIQRDGENWVITIELTGNIPESTDPTGVVEWDIMVDADNDIATGWQSSLLFNDLGVDYYIWCSKSGSDYVVNAQRVADSSVTYSHFVGYNVSGNRVTIRFNPDAIGGSNNFSFIVIARQYSIIGDPESLIAADKIPDSKHYGIYVPAP